MSSLLNMIKNNRLALIVYGISLIAACCSIYASYGSNDFWTNVKAGFVTSFFDLILVTFLLGLYEKARRKQEKISEMKRRIDDFKKLNDAYGHAMIGASLRELALFDVSNVDFTGVELSDFVFMGDHGIKSLKDSTFSHGMPFDRWLHWGSKLTNVSFSRVDCRNVVFGDGNLSLCFLKDCDFHNADLREARFVGVRIECSEDKFRRNEADWSEIVDETEDGEPISAQTYQPMFSDANLDAVDFSQSWLKSIDFRGAKNILNATFYKAQGLETCLFDEGIRERLNVL